MERKTKVMLSAYIEMLQDFLRDSGDGEVCITESGYYSWDKYAPELFKEPRIEGVVDGVPRYSLGHSHQNY